MSIFKIKDLDYFLATLLDDETLFILNICNKYYYNLFNEDFWKKRFNMKYREYIRLEDNYINVHREKWKKYYYITHILLKEREINKSIYYSISKDLPDLFYLIIFKKDINPYVLLNYGGSILFSGMSFIPINTMIYKDSINCFETFFSLERYNPSFYLDIAIERKSHKISNYLQKFVELDILSLKII